MTLIEQHHLDVGDIQTQMKNFFSRGEKVKIYHGSTNSTRAQKFEKDRFIDVSKLGRVLEVNTIDGYVLAEPNVPMDQLVEETLRYGFVPLVVMEFPGITVGGAFKAGREKAALSNMVFLMKFVWNMKL